MSDIQILLRQRFIEACTQRDAIVTKMAPLREQRDGILAKAQAQLTKADSLIAQIKQLEAPLYDLHNEIATISRALNGQTA
jgi:uncharacterized coiled-coil DUF342 family protein